MKKIAFIINPISGTSDKKDLPGFIHSIMDRNIWEEPVIVQTERAGHGKELAQQFASEGFDVVVACGGDGTMNEVASGVIGTQTAFSIVPYGSGNGLARHYDFSMTPKKAVEQINAGVAHNMDYGTVEGHNFFCTCGTGFDAHISHVFAHADGRGLINYLKAVLSEYFHYHPYEYTLKMRDEKTGDVEEVKQKAFVVTFGNASQFGNNAYIVPNASTEDGMLDICILEPFKTYEVPKLAIQLFHGTIDHNMHVKMLRSKEATLIRDYEGEFHIDGEPILLGKEIHIQIVSGQLKIWR